MDKLIIAQDSDRNLAIARDPSMAANPQAVDAINWSGDWHRPEYKMFTPARLIASEIETRQINISRAYGNTYLCDIYTALREMLKMPLRAKSMRDAILNPEAFLEIVATLPLDRAKIHNLQNRDMLYRHFHEFFDEIYRSEDDASGKHTTFLSIDPLCNLVYLSKTGALSRNHILAILAISGIETRLPSVFLATDDRADDVPLIDEIRDKYSAERRAYMDYLGQFVQECYERIVDGYYVDAWDFAKIKSDEEIRLACEKYEAAVSKSGQNLRKHLLIGSLHGVPEITRSLFGANIPRDVGIELLRIAVGSISERLREARARASYPMASYIYKIKRELEAARRPTTERQPPWWRRLLGH